MSKSYFQIRGVESTAAFHRESVKSHSNLEQRLRLKCKRGSEKSLQESVPQRSRLTEAPLCSVGRATHCPRICVLWAFMCFLYSSYWFSYTPHNYTTVLVLKGQFTVSGTNEVRRTKQLKQTNKQNKRTWMECFTELEGVHECSSGGGRLFLRQP